MTKDIYVFPDIVNRVSENESTRLDVTDEGLLFVHGIDGNERKALIVPESLRDGSSTVIVCNPFGDLFVLYNYRELLQVFNLTPSEFHQNFQCRGFMQIDKCGDALYIKAFLLKGDFTLDSHTDDFSCLRHCTADSIHPLDWEYSYTIGTPEAFVQDGTLHVSFSLSKSSFWTRPLYASHGGKTIELHEGMNSLEFPYNKFEMVYLGEPNARYKGRRLDVERLMSNKIHYRKA